MSALGRSVEKVDFFNGQNFPEALVRSSENYIGGDT
jgi:hypothetical protein